MALTGREFESDYEAFCFNAGSRFNTGWLSYLLGRFDESTYSQAIDKGRGEEVAQAIEKIDRSEVRKMLEALP